jgi:peroxiredoxin
VPKTLLTVGEPAPWFTARCTSNPTFHFDTIAGRYVVLCFFGSAGQSASRQALDGFLRYRSGFDDENLCFFGVSTDPEDERQGRVQETLPGVRYFWDFDRQVSRLYGAVARGEGGQETYHPHTLVLDSRLRVLATLPFLYDDAAAKIREENLRYVDLNPPTPPAAG